MDTKASTMPVMMICPNLKCRKVLQVPAKYRGQQVKCHYCTMLFSIPTVKTRDKASAKPEEKKA